MGWCTFFELNVQFIYFMNTFIFQSERERWTWKPSVMSKNILTLSKVTQNCSSSSQIVKIIVSAFKERNRIYIKGFHKSEQNSAFFKTFAAIFVLFTWYPGFLSTMPNAALSMTWKQTFLWPRKPWFWGLFGQEFQDFDPNPEISWN